MAELPALAMVRRLELRHPSDGHDRAFADFLRLPHLSAVAELDISLGHPLDDDSAVALAAWPGLAGVRRLRLPPFRTAEGLRTVLSSPLLADLHWLGFRIPDETVEQTIEALRAWPGFARLRQLEFTGGQTAHRWLWQGNLPTMLQTVSLAGDVPVTEAIGGWLAHPDLTRLRELRVSDYLHPCEAMPPSDGPYNSLRLVSIMGNAVSDDAVAVLARSPRLASVSALRLHGPRLTRSAAISLADSPYLTGLRSLEFLAANIGPVGVRALARSRSLSGLTRLVLIKVTLGNGSEAIADATWARSLVELGLANEQLTVHAVQALATAPLANLRVLWAHSMRQRTSPWAGLASASWLAGLEELHLTNACVDDAALCAFAGSLGRELRRLTLRGNPISASGLAALLTQPLPRLMSLNLASVRLNAASAGVLAGWPGLANLFDLELTADWVDDLGVAALSASPFWNRRTLLRLNQSKNNDRWVNLTGRVRIQWETPMG